MPADACVRIVDRVADICSPALGAATSPPSASPNFDALAVSIGAQSSSIAAQANSIAAQANFLTGASIALAALAVIAGIAWGYLVRTWAKEVARNEVRDWMENNALQDVANLQKQAPNINPGGGGLSQEEQEQGLGKDPA